MAGSDLLADDLRLEEEAEVVAAAGLGVGAAHVEAAEGVAADEGAGGLPVDVEIAGVELALRPVDPGATVVGPGEAVFAVVRELDRVVVVARLQHGKHGPEDFFARDLRLRGDVGDDGRLDEEAVARHPLSAGDEPAFALAD